MSVGLCASHIQRQPVLPKLIRGREQKWIASTNKTQARGFTIGKKTLVRVGRSCMGRQNCGLTSRYSFTDATCQSKKRLFRYWPWTLLGGRASK